MLAGLQPHAQGVAGVGAKVNQVRLPIAIDIADFQTIAAIVGQGITLGRGQIAAFILIVDCEFFLTENDEIVATVAIEVGDLH